jgi:hypothetical protein
MLYNKQLKPTAFFAFGFLQVLMLVVPFQVSCQSSGTMKVFSNYKIYLIKPALLFWAAA